MVDGRGAGQAGRGFDHDKQERGRGGIALLRLRQAEASFSGKDGKEVADNLCLHPLGSLGYFGGMARGGLDLGPKGLIVGAILALNPRPDHVAQGGHGLIRG